MGNNGQNGNNRERHIYAPLNLRQWGLMKNIVILLFSVLYFSFNTNAQTILEGRVISSFTGNPVPFAIARVMFDNSLVTGTTANEEGCFKIEINDNIDSFQLVLACFGYEQTIVPIVISELDTMNNDFIIGRIFTEEEYLFTAKDAARDIENGVVQIYMYGLPAVPPDVMSEIIKKNGLEYKIKYLGCRINQNIIESVKQYNAYVYKYLKEQYGEKWNEGINKNIEIYLLNNE